MIDVYFYEAFEEEASALRRLIGDRYSCGFSAETVQESGHTAPESRVVSIRTQSIVPADWAGTIGGVLSRSTGYDHLKALRSRINHPLPCGFLEEYATRAVAEHAILLLLSLFRKINAQVSQFHSFHRDGLTGVEIGGKKLLVVGVGRIGSEVVRIARGMGMEVRGVDIDHRHPDVQYIDREKGIRWADVVICAMNLTEQNRGYFSASFLRNAHKGVFFVNIARGEHAPTRDLLDLLGAGHLGGVALDVFESEPDVAVSLRNPTLPATAASELIRRLLAYPNVLCTPHNAFNTHEAVERKAAFTVEQLAHFFTTGDFKWKI